MYCGLWGRPKGKDIKSKQTTPMAQWAMSIGLGRGKLVNKHGLTILRYTYGLWQYDLQMMSFRLTLLAVVEDHAIDFLQQTRL